MDYTALSVSELRKLCSERSLGSGAWRVGASKAALISALDGTATPSALQGSSNPSSGLDLAAIIGAAIAPYVSNQLDETRVAEMIHSALASRPNNVLEIRKPNSSPVIVGRQHYQFSRLLAALCCNVWIYGPAGGGKTSAVEACARALNVPYHCLQVGPQTSQMQIFGYTDAMGRLVRTDFREAYEHGGILLIDEIDAGNAGVLTALNAALANGKCAFPDGMIERHKDCLFVATANTIGNGASRQYVGRNQVDAATTDRFVKLVWNYDESFESALCGVDCEPTPQDFKPMEGPYDSAIRAHVAAVQSIRQTVNRLGLRVIVSPRASINGCKLIQAGFSGTDALQMTIFEGLDIDTVTKLKGAK